MGSVFAHFEGTRWDRLGYDSYDFDQCCSFLGVRRWSVHYKGKHTIVCASTIVEAKQLAHERRGFPVDQIDCVHMLHH